MGDVGSRDRQVAVGSALVGGARVIFHGAARRLGLGRLRDSVRAADWWLAEPPQRLKDLDMGGQLPARAAALTFDDGPDPAVTPRLLDVLSSSSVRATFFMCGLAAKNHPSLVRAVAADGHTIGGHSWDHRPMIRLSPAEWNRQVNDTHALLEELTGSAVRWFRPPWGESDWSTRRRLRQEHIATVHWSVHGRDWTERNPSVITELVLRGLNPGAIVLLHDAIASFDSPTGIGNRRQLSQEPTLQAVDRILHVSRQRNLDLIPLDELSVVRLPSLDQPRWRRTRSAQRRSSDIGLPEQLRQGQSRRLN